MSEFIASEGFLFRADLLARNTRDTQKTPPFFQPCNPLIWCTGRLDGAEDTTEETIVWVLLQWESTQDSQAQPDGVMWTATPVSDREEIQQRAEKPSTTSHVRMLKKLTLEFEMYIFFFSSSRLDRLKVLFWLWGCLVFKNQGPR